MHRQPLPRRASSHESADDGYNSGGGDESSHRPRTPSSPVEVDHPKHAHDPDHHQLVPILSQITFYLVPPKLDVAAVSARIDELGGKIVGDWAEARIVLTGLKGKPRLERLLGPRAGSMANLLSVSFVYDAYARAKDAPEGTIPHLPGRSAYRVLGGRELGTSRSPSIEVIDPPAVPGRPHKRRRVGSSSSPAPAAVSAPVVPPSVGPDIVPYPVDIRLKDIPRFCCQRPSPLECPNQDIIDAIKPIYLEREYDEADQKNSNVLSYRRSMSILKSVPRRIKSGAEARKLMDVGEKVAKRIDEYLTTGTVAESVAILNSPRYQAMEQFASIYTIGKSTAAELWDKGCRTLADVRRVYVDEDEDVSDGGEGDRAKARARSRRRRDGTMTRGETVAAWLGMKDDLDEPIPQAEVLEIEACVMEQVHALVPGCVDTVCGGYRRGKHTTSDVDIILTPPPAAAGQDLGLIKLLVRRLYALGIVTHVLHMTTRDPHTPLHSNPANFDNLDKAFVVLRLPRPGAMHRRVDLICAPRERYAAATLSWSGSMMFERDLRRIADDLGYKFRAGIIDRVSNVEINFDTEREILAFLGLAYVPPELRNADG